MKMFYNPALPCWISLMATSTFFTFTKATTGIRLNGGSNYGRVEVFQNGKWGTVCDQYPWNINSASVVCRQLGFTYAVNNFYDSYDVIYDSAPIWLAIKCRGNESSIFQCFNIWGNHSCGYYYSNFGVRCSSQVVRLIGSLSSRRVEYFNKGTWNEICPYKWDDNAARVVCRQLGFNNGNGRTSEIGETRNISRKIIGCFGNESSILECAHVLSNDSISDYMCKRQYAMANCYRVLQIASGKQVRINFTAKVSYLRKYSSIYISFRPSKKVASRQLFYLYINQYYNYSHSNDDRVLFEWEKQQSFLLVNTTICDSGTYTLYVHTYYLSTRFDVNVIVADVPRIISFYGAVTKNDSLTLTCSADGLPTPICTIISNKMEIKRAQNAIAIIPNYSLNDNVTYKCICRNSVGHDTKYFPPISYKDVPRIIYFYGAITKNDSLTLTCSAEGLPTPICTIMSDKREIEKAQNAIAIIPNYSLNDNVTYKCICRNSLGHDTKYFSPISYRVLISWQRNKSRDDGTTSKINWYFSLISAIVGVFVGIILVHGVQWLCRKKTNRGENPQPGTSNPGYNAQADPTPPVEAVYEELDLKKLEEENKYQSLQHAS